MLRLFLIGLVMGCADLLPGISGGTVAFIAGIYEQLLESIKTLQFQSFKKIPWSFLLPLAGGIVTSILLFSRLMHFLMQHYPAPLFGFIFGLIAASTFLFARQTELKRPLHWTALILGGALSYGLTIIPCGQAFGSNALWIVFAGMLGAGGLLLPGISGSYILQIIGVYPLVIYALQMPLAPASLKLLATLGIGIALGFIIFSRLISQLLKHFHHLTMATLIGFMIGGLKALWPFGRGDLLWPLVWICLGIVVIVVLEKIMRPFSKRPHVSSSQ